MNPEDELYLNRIHKTLAHISNVQKNVMILAEKLILQGEREMARQLILNSLQHDISKLGGIEWDYLLSDDEEKLKLAIAHHNRTNPHHPQHWGGVDNMPDVYLAEMVADWKARSSELGTDFMKWVNVDAPNKYKYSTNKKTHKKIKHFASLLMEEGFKKLKQ